MSRSKHALISIYDLDRTITSIPTWTYFLVRSACRAAPWRLLLLPALPIAALGKKMRLYDRGRLKELMHALMLGRRLASAQVEASAEAFADVMVQRHMRPGALAQIAADRNEGRRIVIATASHAFVARAIARRLGVDDLIATQARRDDQGNLLNMLDGPNRYGDAKHAAVLQWMMDMRLERSRVSVRFYTDDASDAVTLRWADEAVAVNPNRALRRLAARESWRVVDWGRQRRRSANHALAAAATLSFKR